MKIPNRCVDCRFKSKSNTCYNYINQDNTGAQECINVAQECQDDDDYTYIHWVTNGRTLLTLDEINELKRTEKLYENNHGNHINTNVVTK